MRLTKDLKERPEPARVRLSLDIDERLRREVKLEAFRRGVSVREYVTDLILRDRGVSRPDGGEEAS
jgi:predicted HicB family RNase H-like nuclease